MIKPEDVEFHEVPAAQAELWAETNYFPFSIPQAGISGCIYNVFRPGLGVCLSDVTIFDKCATHWEGLAYTDHQQHIPCPSSLANYSLRNGVSVLALNWPSDYRIDYIGIDDTELHVDFTGLMRPQDFNDPAQDPLAQPSPTQKGAWDNAFNGHFDMTGRVRGELVLRGARYAIDCLATMDHSWGPRHERDNGNAAFIQAHFGADFSINALLALNPRAMNTVGPVLHGYVMRAGSVRALIAGQGLVHRENSGWDKLFPQHFEFSLTDEDGEIYKLSGEFQTWAPWAPYSSVIYYQGMTRWRLHDQIGYGAYQEVLSRAAVARHSLSK